MLGAEEQRKFPLQGYLLIRHALEGIGIERLDENRRGAGPSGLSHRRDQAVLTPIQRAQAI